MKRLMQVICLTIIAALAISLPLPGAEPKAAESEKAAVFSTDEGDNPRKTDGHEYSVTVVVGSEFAKKYGLKIAVKPERVPDSCWLQTASFTGSGKDSSIIFLGLGVVTHEKFTLLLLKYEKGRNIPSEGQIAVDRLENQGFEIVDKIQVERMK
jgi:hypothetical protein